MFDQNLFVGKLPSAEQTSQFIPVSELVFFVLLLGQLLPLLGLRWAGLWWRGLLLFLFLLVVTVPSIFPQEANQWVHHLRLERRRPGINTKLNLYPGACFLDILLWASRFFF